MVHLKPARAAALMGCDPGQFRAVLVEIVPTLESAYATLQAPSPKEPS